MNVYNSVQDHSMWHEDTLGGKWCVQDKYVFLLAKYRLKMY